MPEGNATGVPLVGDVIAGKYRVDSILGEGGMGIVYEAEHLILRQRVAIKALLPGVGVSPEIIERFSFEASTVARLTSEHVVRVMDAGTLPSGSPYLVMEYLAGCDLDTLLARRGPMPEAEVVDFALQALEALSHAHAAGIIHRDLKPANLFLAKRKDRPIIKLLDFGISKSVGMRPDGDRVLGSPLYMSPEQLQKNAQIDHRTDLWSLGVVIYQLVCGAPPFGGAFQELIASIRNSDPISLHARDPRVSPGLSEVVTRCMSREREARWGSAQELAAALVPFGSGTWSSVLERIAAVIKEAEPVRSTRSFESFENALQALEVEPHRDPEPTAESTPARSKLMNTWTETLPPESEEAVHAVTCVPPSLLEHEPALQRRPALRILLVEDSADSVHQRLLTEAGFDVRSVAAAPELDALLEEWKPHLVMMAVTASLNGEAMCRRVKTRFKATFPIVLFADLSRDELAARSKEAGADGFVSKGADEELVEYVRNICAMTYSPEDLP